MTVIVIRENLNGTLLLTGGGSGVFCVRNE